MCSHVSSACRTVVQASHKQHWKVCKMHLAVGTIFWSLQGVGFFGNSVILSRFFFFFFILAYEYYMDPCNQSCLSGSLAWTCWISHACLAVLLELVVYYLHTCHACRHHWLVPFYTTVSDTGFGLGSQSRGKAKPVSFFFLAHFWTDQSEIWYCVEVIHVEHPETFWGKCLESREITAVSLTASRKNNIGMHVQKPVWFQLDTMMGPFELYTLTLAFFQSHRCARKNPTTNNRN